MRRRHWRTTSRSEFSSRSAITLPDIFSPTCSMGIRPGRIVFNNPLDPDDTAFFGTRFVYPYGTNYGAYSNAPFDQLPQRKSLRSIRSGEPLFHQMQQLLHYDVPALWLYSPDDLAAASARVHGYAPAPYSLDTWNSWQWWVDPPVAHTSH